MVVYGRYHDDSFGLGLVRCSYLRDLNVDDRKDRERDWTGA